MGEAGHFGVLRDIAVVMTVAGAVAIIFHRLRFPFVLGYLVAGILLSPGVYPAMLGQPIHDMRTVSGLVDVGIVFLVFNIGMEFRLYRLKQLGVRVVLCGLIEAAVMFLVGTWVGRTMGWGTVSSLFLGAILVPCSTIILSKSVGEAGLVGRPFARMAMGLAILEDLVVIVLLVVLTAVGQGASPDLENLWGIAWRMIAFLAAAIVGGLLVVPRLMNRLHRAHHQEALVIVTFGLCFGFPLVATRLGYSGALGAFVMGLIAAESLAREWLLRRLEPMREFFAALFFVSIGVLFDARLFLEHAGEVAAVACVFALAKAGAVFSGGVVTGFHWKRSLRAGAAMTNLGEFSFILASAATAQGLAPATLYPMIVGVCVISAAWSPLVIRRIDRLADGVDTVMPGPLRTFLALYESRIAQPWAPRQPGRWWKVLRRPIQRLAVEVAAMSAVVAAVPALRSGVAHFWRGGGYLSPELVAWGLAVVLCVPAGVAAWRNIGVVAMVVSEMAVPRSAAGAGRGLFEKAVGGAVTGFAGLLVVGWLVVLSQPFLPPWPVTAGLILAGVVLSTVLWRKMVQVHHRIETAIQLSLDQATDLSSVARREVRQLLEDRYPVQAGIRELIVLPDSQVVGQSLRQLRLREETGATVLSIRRSGFELVNPAADSVLFPEDHLLVVGGADDLERVDAFFRRSRPRDVLSASEVWTVRLTDYSPAVGHSLGELNLRFEAGVSVVAVIRNGENQLNPDPGTVLAVGDALVLFGTLAQLSQAGALLGGEMMESPGGVS